MVFSCFQKPTKEFLVSMFARREWSVKNASFRDNAYTSCQAEVGPLVADRQVDDMGYWKY